MKNKIGIIGFGETGKSVAEFFLARGAEIEIYDDKNLNHPQQRADFDWKNLAAVVVSPGVHLLWPHIHPLVEKARKNFVPIINDIDVFQKETTAKNICVTGTNGKSTTTALINFVIARTGHQTQIGGNFGGCPALSLAKNNDCNVLELSSYQLEACNILGFNIAVLLNITPDHLTRHGGMKGYISAKQKIFANFKNESRAIIGIDDEYCVEIFEFLKTINHPHLIPISGVKIPVNGIGWDGDFLIDNRAEKPKKICRANPSLDGPHNRQNIAASYAACATYGIDENDFAKFLFNFQGLEHRQELIKIIDGVQYINDSKATNADSAEQALRRFDDIIWILGGRPKENGIESLCKYFHKIKYAFLIGEAAADWSLFLQKNNVPNEIVKTLDIAVKKSHQSAKTIDAKTVLLSPACASFDQFKSYEERGKKFKSLVEAL